MGQVVISFRKVGGPGGHTLRAGGAKRVCMEGLVLLSFLLEEPKLDGANGRLGAVGDSELTEDPVQVFLDGTRAN
jgi:hypothetical protein